MGHQRVRSDLAVDVVVEIQVEGKLCIAAFGRAREEFRQVVQREVPLGELDDGLLSVIVALEAPEQRHELSCRVFAEDTLELKPIE